MLNFRLIFWFLEYVTYYYGKCCYVDFDKDADDIMSMIWEFNKKYNEVTKNVPF